MRRSRRALLPAGFLTVRGEMRILTPHTSHQPAFLLAPPPPRDMWVCLACRGEERTISSSCRLARTTQNTPSFRSLFTSLSANNVSTPWLIVHDQCFIHCQNFQTEVGMFYLFSLKIFQTSLFIFCDIYRVSQLHRGLLGFTSGL